MGILVYVLGRSGTGKSYSMRNFPKEKLAVINVQGKILPFKGSCQVTMTCTDTSKDIVDALDFYARRGFKSIVVDDFQYVMANEFMRRSAERGYDKFTEIGRHAWDIANTVRSLPGDCIVYVMCHTDRDDEGNEKIKTIGKLLDEKICLEGMSTIVLMTNVTDGVYTFLTQNNGKNTVKSPAGMFPSYAIDNDLWYVDQKIRSYYEMGDYLPEEEMSKIDEQVKKDDIPMDGKKEKKRRGKKKEEELAEASEEEAKAEAGAEAEQPAEELTEPAAEKPKRRRRPTSEASEEESNLALANQNQDDVRDEVPFDEAEDPEELPKRKSRKKAETSAPETVKEDTYYMTGDKKWMVKAGEPVPSADSLKDAQQITKEEYETAMNPPAAPEMETPEGGRRRRRRRTAE